MNLPAGTVGKLIRCWYGTRDAGSLWEDTYANVLIGLGFSRGKPHPAVTTIRRETSRWWSMEMTLLLSVWKTISNGTKANSNSTLKSVSLSDLAAGPTISARSGSLTGSFGLLPTGLPMRQIPGMSNYWGAHLTFKNANH